MKTAKLVWATAAFLPLMLSQTLSFASAPKEYFADYASFNEKGQKFLDGIDVKTGKISLANGIELSLPEGFYYLDPADAQEVLEGAWGNPPGNQDDTMGMIFPAKYSPLSDHSWGIEISYDNSGHVKDDDAATINYDELLAELKSDTLAGNEDRKKDGYEPITLVGWASPPVYDGANKRAHWAKELQFGDDSSHTLNYDVRFLGRNGVLVMRYIAGMDQLPEIKGNLDPVLSLVSFKDGWKYSDFDPSIDTVAAVGIGGLIAGKLAAKAGLLAFALVFLKKFAVLALAPIAWLVNKFKRKSSDS